MFTLSGYCLHLFFYEIHPFQIMFYGVFFMLKCNTTVLGLGGDFAHVQRFNFAAIVLRQGYVLQ